MDPNFSWIYLAIFLIIPLARIIPRLMARRRMQGERSEILEKQSQQTYERYAEESKVEPKPQTKNMLVLGALNRGSKTFESIQKNTGLKNQELDKVLEDLEKKGFLSVRQKQGIFGTKTELFPTDKGFKEYYS